MHPPPPAPPLAATSRHRSLPLGRYARARQTSRPHSWVCDCVALASSWPRRHRSGPSRCLASYSERSAPSKRCNRAAAVPTAERRSERASQRGRPPVPASEMTEIDVSDTSISRWPMAWAPASAFWRARALLSRHGTPSLRRCTVVSNLPPPVSLTVHTAEL